MRCGGGGSLTYPVNRETWNKTYGQTFKPLPELDSVTIDYAGDWGLARKISATIRCYTVNDFKNVQRYFLMPGNEIDVKFGYNVQWSSGQSGVSLKGYKVATFNFNTTDDGMWMCSFEAVSSAEAIKNLDIQSVICNGCNAIGGNGSSGNSGPLKYIDADGTSHPVKGIAQLIASDSQKNGQTSIDDMQDGEVITSFTDMNAGAKHDNSAAIVVYTGDHLRNTLGKITAWMGGIMKEFGMGASEVESSNNQVYVSLAYVVNRIINDQLLRSLTCQVAHEREKFVKLKVEFHPKYSKSKVSDGITSGDPVHVLLLGKANYKNSSGEGKDFDSDCKNLGTVTSYQGGGDIKLQNILLHRDVIIAAFNEATQKRESESDTTDVKNMKEEVVNIVDFFNKISDQISSVTGGAISLRLVENPDDTTSLIVVDQNYGVTSTLQCVVFDPIDGDGSTIKCSLQSNVGSQEYKAAMFVGASKKGDSVANLRGCKEKLTAQRGNEHAKALEDYNAIVTSPGNMGKNYFDGTEINALKSVMARLNKSNDQAATNETIHYPGLSMTIDIHGVWGFVPGNAISTTQVPSEWRNAYKSYFMLRRVTHKFQASQWVTTLDGILAYYPNTSYIQL
jgi:hypothetical protein